MATAVSVTRSDRVKARQAEEVGREILRCCRGLVSAHEVRVADPEDVPAGKPLVSLELFRLGAEAHAYRSGSIGDELADALEARARELRGDDRLALLRIGKLIRGVCEPVYRCVNCREEFRSPVVHCPRCDHHYPKDDGHCRNCYRKLGDLATAKLIRGV